MIYNAPFVGDKKLSNRWQIARRVYRSVTVTKHGTIRYVSYGFLLVCFVRKIFDFKNVVTLKSGLGGPSRSLKMSPFDGAHITSYWRSIVTMAVSCVISEIFNVEKHRDLEIEVKGQSRSLKVVPFDRMGMVSYQCSL